MTELLLLKEIELVIDRTSPTWFVTDEEYIAMAATARKLADAADALGFEGVWLRMAAGCVASEHRATGVDHIRAKLAGLAYNIRVGLLARPGYRPTREWAETPAR